MLPFLPFSNKVQQLQPILDGVSDVIDIPIGLPFGLQTHTTAYVGDELINLLTVAFVTYIGWH